MDLNSIRRAYDPINYGTLLKVKGHPWTQLAVLVGLILMTYVKKKIGICIFYIDFNKVINFIILIA